MYRYYEYYIKKFRLEDHLDNLWLNGYIREIWDFFATPLFDSETESLFLDHKPYLEVVDWRRKCYMFIRNYVEERLAGNLVNFIKKLI